MIDAKGFKEWLTENTNFSKRVVGNTVCRMRRVDRIQDWDEDEHYLYNLEKNDEFLELTVSVKSQCRRAVRLYTAYANAISALEK